MTGYEFLMNEGRRTATYGKCVIVSRGDNGVRNLMLINEGKLIGLVEIFNKENKLYCFLTECSDQRIRSAFVKNCVYTDIGMYVYDSPVRLEWLMTDIRKLAKSL